MNHFAFLFIGVIAKVRVVDSIYLLKGSILTCAFLFF